MPALVFSKSHLTELEKSFWICRGGDGDTLRAKPVPRMHRLASNPFLNNKQNNERKQTNETDKSRHKAEEGRAR